MPYSSEVKLQIGEVPKTVDQAAFPDMVDLFNSVHILLQYANSLKDLIQPPLTPTTPAYDSMPIRNQVYGIITQTVTAGNILTPSGPANSSSWLKGGPSPMRVNGTTRTMQGGGVIGIALESGTSGQKIKIGIGPAAVKVTGVTMGQFIYARPALLPTGAVVNDGNMYNSDIITAGGSLMSPNNMIIGMGIGQDTVYLFDHVDAYSTAVNKTTT